MLQSWLAFVTLVLLAFSAPAMAADWLHGGIRDEFDGKHRYFAISSATEPNLGFVCEFETGRIKLLFKTNERSTRDLSKRMPILFNRIVLIVDDDPVRSYPGTVDEIEHKIVAQSYDDTVIALANTISNAQRRVLVAVDMAGEKYFRQEFPVSGSGRAIATLLQTCPKK